MHRVRRGDVVSVSGPAPCQPKGSGGIIAIIIVVWLVIGVVNNMSTKR